tara:strand:- start:897 stop:1517 length:621 start_codon:yes stop_codon:yes gene_type:complete
MRDKIKQVMALCRDDGMYVNKNGQHTVSAWSKIKYFRQVFGSDYGVQFKLMEHSDRALIMKCIISTKDPEFIVSEGFSKQYRDKPGYFDLATSFSFCRALTYLGILDDDLTSKEEYDELGLDIRKESKDTSQLNDDVDVEDVKDSFKKAIHLPRLKYLKDVVYKDTIDYLLKNEPRLYKEITDVIETREFQLEQENNFTNTPVHNN